MFDKIKYNRKKSKEKAECKKGNHTPGMTSWTSGTFTHSYCIFCKKEIVEVASDLWKEVIL